MKNFKTKLIAFCSIVFLMSFSLVPSANAGCDDEGNYNNGKKRVIQGDCICDESSNRHQCFIAPPVVE